MGLGNYPFSRPRARYKVYSLTGCSVSARLNHSLPIDQPREPQLVPDPEYL